MIEGDITTSYDAQAIAKLGIPSVELNTDGACHIEAMSIQEDPSGIQPGCARCPLCGKTSAISSARLN